MAENAVVHIGENSPEEVAYKLMHDIARAEKIYLNGASLNSNRNWIIKTYCQCLQAVRNPYIPDDVVAGYQP